MPGSTDNVNDGNKSPEQPNFEAEPTDAEEQPTLNTDEDAPLDGRAESQPLDGESEEFLSDKNGLSDSAIELQKQIQQIKVEMPEQKPKKEEEVFDPDLFPESYKENTNKEKLIIKYAENFQKQYVHLFRDRKPLFMNPINECGCEKFVSTTIRVTPMPYKELYDWSGCAELVADYLNYDSLDPPYKLPKRLLSPTTVLKRQAGNCFEYSTLLCSLLLGSGYDAYVVCGYATREICNTDETRDTCPILKKKPAPKEETKKAEAKKYAVKPPKDLRSKFILKQEARKKKADDDAVEKRRVDAEHEREESEKPPIDELRGLRIHSWVLVLDGKREVTEKFFIDPLTGISYPTNSPQFLGIESLWNNKNYWVNMQICTDGVQELVYDLDDCTLWEFVFPGGEKSTLLLPEDDDDMGDDDEKNEEVEKYLDMPPSWVEPLEMTLKDYQTRCPLGKKVKLYNRATLEKFAPYLLKDGLVTRLTVYEDIEKSDLISSRELYKNRVDKLLERIHNQRTGWVVEHFAPGRAYNIRDHHYKAVSPGIENERLMTFYHEARVDGLERRVENATEMTEQFVNRPDFLYFRQVFFGKRAKKFAPSSESNPRPILKIVEKYNRDPAIPANESISELEFHITEDKILLTYHTDDSKIACTTREFTKPQTNEEKSGTIQWNPEGYSKFLVEPRKGDKKSVDLYQLLVKLVQREEKCKERVRSSEDEVRAILEMRMKEESVLDMEVSIYDTARNEKAKKHRAELERLELEEKLRKQEKELDYLAPFLAQMGDIPRINSSQIAIKLKEDCLADLKYRLLEKANIIQARFEKEAAELQKKQAWYQQNQVTMQKEDEEEYLAYCSDAMFRIHILELRLNRHKETAPMKYMDMERKLRNDPRLIEFL